MSMETHLYQEIRVEMLLLSLNVTMNLKVILVAANFVI